MLSILSYFKTIKHHTLSSHSVLNGSVCTKELATQCVSNYFNDVCSGTNTTNLVMLHNAIFYFLSTDIYMLFDIVYSCFCEEAIKIRENFQELITNDALTPIIYYEAKRHYNSFNLWHLFSFVNQYVEITPSKNDICHILNEYAFYSNVIYRPYDYNDTTKHIFDILCKATTDNNIVFLFKIFNQFNGFSFSLLNKTLRYNLFDPYIDTIIKNMCMSDNMLINNMALINNTINSICTSSDKHCKEKQINELVDIVDMCQKIGNCHLFFALYKKYLQDRLLTNNCNLELETTLAKLLNFAKNPDACILSHYSINDVLSSNTLNEAYQTIDIKCVSRKYDNIEINQSCAKFFIGRSYVWNTLKCDSIYDNFKPPALLSIYTESFQRFYSDYLNKSGTSFSNRNIAYNYPMSHVELNVSIDDKQYTFKMTFVQACIFIYINDNVNLTAYLLSQLIGIPLKHINVEINSLLLATLIIRDITFDATDPSMSFSINTNYNSSNTDMTKFVAKYETLAVCESKENSDNTKCDDIKEKIEIDSDTFSEP